MAPTWAVPGLFYLVLPVDVDGFPLAVSVTVQVVLHDNAQPIGVDFSHLIGFESPFSFRGMFSAQSLLFSCVLSAMDVSGSSNLPSSMLAFHLLAVL